MPELPEVEVIRRDIERALKGLLLRQVILREARLPQNCTEAQLRRALVGRRLEGMGRRGKFLLFHFGAHSAVFHLRMSGRFALEPGPGTHTRLILQFESGRCLYFDDTRRFATLHLTETERLDELEPLCRLGLDPLSPGYTPSAFRRRLQSRREVKRLLLDQTRIAGLGNIYATEALFAARVHPQRPARSLTPLQIRRLYEAIPRLLEAAIARHGSTLGDSVGDYRTLSGARGGFQDRFAVYGRAGEPCPACGTPIERLVQGGRSSTFCPRCQR